uniref:Uncharacterized protein n=1 Tax=Schistosoma mansoni TaxID=6183 RepID=A0AA82N841_SCHMA
MNGKIQTNNAKIQSTYPKQKQNIYKIDQNELV